MSDLTLYLGQVNQFWEDPERNQEHLEKLISECNPEKGSLLVLPEMFNTSFTTNPESNYQDWENSSSINWLRNQSLKYEIAITTSLIIKESDNYYNRLVFIDNGEIKGHYNKNYLFSLAKENEKFTAGTNNLILNYRGWKIAPLICYDLRFPELSRINNKKESLKYDLLIYVANWPMKRIQHWEKLLHARAIENLTYCIGVNRVGKDGNDIEYNGKSKVIDPIGNPILEFQDFEESFKRIVLAKSEVDQIRQRFGFLNDIK